MFNFAFYFANLNIFASNMPPKSQKKQTESRELDVVSEMSLESEDNEVSVAGSSASQRTLTNDHLERLLEAQHRNMAT